MIKKIMNFGLVGIISTGIDFILLYFMTSILAVSVFIATPLAFIVALVFNYFASMKYVFVANPLLSVSKQSMIFLITSLIGLVINQVVMYLCVEQLAIHYLIGKGLTTGLTMVFNFCARTCLLEERT